MVGVIFIMFGDALPLSRRRFLETGLGAAAGFLSGPHNLAATPEPSAALPTGAAPGALEWPHFPDRLHAFVWRNWPLVPAERLGKVVGATRPQLERIAFSMGLPAQAPISRDQQRRSYLTVIRRNWHLLPYGQLLELLEWDRDQLAFALREDDFLFVKLGNLKPRCAELRYSRPTKAAATRARGIARIVGEEFRQPTDRLFGFVSRLSRAPRIPGMPPGSSKFEPRFCYSYFALYGDPLLGTEADFYPDGYLARLAEAGVDGVWLQAVLYKLAAFPWDSSRSAGHLRRLENLGRLAARARRHGIRVYLYLNEPRAMPGRFFRDHPELEGVREGGYSALCTSVPAVADYLENAVAQVARAAPDLGGFFTITASENLTNCWSHGAGARCRRCGGRTAAEVIAEVNAIIRNGIRKAKSRAELIVWDWGWPESSAEDIIRRLPTDAAFMSVSEWNIPIERAGVKNSVGEYSISVIGPGARALRRWNLARQRGLKTVAKIQANNTWELSAVPYIPAVRNVARHAANLRAAGVDGLMLGWTLGGCPSPNLEVVAEIGRSTRAVPEPLVEEAMLDTARKRFGQRLAPVAVRAWNQFSSAFSEFPFDGGLVYRAPLQFGPSNLLWAEPTGFASTMIGFPYDDLEGWRGVYPAEVFIRQFEKVADGFGSGWSLLKAEPTDGLRPEQQRAWRDELNVAEAAAIHFRSTANQARFVRARNQLAQAQSSQPAQALIEELEKLILSEMDLARRLEAIQRRDSRIGFEASNQYYYVPIDLAEKIVNCRDLLEGWLPALRKKWAL